MAVEIRDNNRDVIGYVQGNEIKAKGGAFTAGPTVLRIDGDEIREPGGFLGGGESVAKIDGSDIIERHDNWTEGEVVACVERRTEVRVMNGGLFSAGTLLATVGDEADLTQTAAAGAAVYFEYLP